jgi:hypothetical protein
MADSLDPNAPPSDVGKIKIQNTDAVDLAASGAPTNGPSGTGAGEAGKASLYRDTATGNIYVNTGTKASPTWTMMEAGGGVPSGPAGGDLAGTYPNPTIALLAVTDAKVAAANKDGAAGTPSMRTLGTGAAQATAGNDARLSDARTPTGAAGGGLTGTYPDPDIVIASNSVPPRTLGSEGNADGIFAVLQLIPAGAGGSPDDVTVPITSVASDIQVIDSSFDVDTAVALSTGQLRSASGGGGSPITSAFDCSITGRRRDNDLSYLAITDGGSSFFRRSDSGIAGSLVLICKKVSS